MPIKSDWHFLLNQTYWMIRFLSSLFKPCLFFSYREKKKGLMKQVYGYAASLRLLLYNRAKSRTQAILRPIISPSQTPAGPIFATRAR